ncbi:MAG TPA: SpoIIE family protein phosphatase [Ignavibacteria bacterium]|nr:SpoIIE family protein phosphatase [Ignavibacteria bacterium]
MKFFNKFSDSTFRFVYIAIAIFCFIILGLIFVNTMIVERITVDDCLWVEQLQKEGEGQGREYSRLDSAVYIIQITPGGVADEAGIKNGDVLVAINGRLFKGSFEAQDILNEFDNETIVYTILRGNEVLNLPIYVYKFFNTQFLIFSIFGFCFIIVGLLVGYSKPKEFTSKLFFFLGCTAAFGVVAYSNVNFITTRTEAFISWLLAACTVIFPPMFLHFFLSYPVKYQFRNRRIVIFILYGLNLAFFLQQFILVNVLKISFASWIARISFTSLYIIAGVVFLIISYRRVTQDSPLKKALGIVLFGTILTAAGIIYFFSIQFSTNVPLFLQNPLLLLPSFLIVAAPLSFGYSIFKYKILDTEFIVKRGIVFAILTTFIICVYLLIVFVLNSLLSGYLRDNGQLIIILSIVVIILSFDYINKKVHQFVDKQFYKERYNYRQSLLDFTQELPYLKNINEILKKISSSVQEVMGISKVSLWIKDVEYEKLLDKNFSDYFGDKYDEIANRSFDDMLLYLYRDNKEPVLLYDANLNEMAIPDEWKNIIKQQGIVLSTPIFFKNKLIGAVNFGDKASNKAFTEEDIDLLKTLASQCAISFENSRLQQEELSKEKIEDELKIARQIQEESKPVDEHNIAGLDIFSYSQPARMIGGDFYDLIKLSEDKILLVVADVSGKGIPAALNMSKIQTMLQFASGVYQTPKILLTELNKLIHEKIERKSFVTMVVALFDLKEKKVRIARAGHNPALVSKNNEVNILLTKGMGLGLESESLFENTLEEEVLDLSDDSLFIFYSDGLTEARNEKKQEFTTNNVIEIVKNFRNFDSKTIVKELVNSVKKFTGFAEQHDDITLVVVKT